MITSINEQLKKIDPENALFIREHYDSDFLDFRISCSNFFDWKKNEKNNRFELLYKNQVITKNYDEILEILPELKHSVFLNKNKRPYFVSDLENIRNAIDNNEGIAIEGGPCLFGDEEVLVIVTLKDGTKYTFDYSTGRRSDIKFTENLLPEFDFHSFVLDNAHIVKDISFIDNKKAVTTDEYSSIYILFDIANSLNCPFVMPIVDMSYQKYLEFVTRNVDINVREKSIYEFREIVHRIAKLYMDVSLKISKEYTNVNYLILHDSDKELLEKYYKARTPFIERNKIIHSLTDVPVRLEPIKDYCTMPALPYYFYGIKNILQIDCLDETDSHRKCKKAHKNTINISALLYPEKVYDNDMTMFNTPLKEKKYIDEN